MVKAQPAAIVRYSCNQSIRDHIDDLVTHCTIMAHNPELSDDEVADWLDASHLLQNVCHKIGV